MKPEDIEGCRIFPHRRKSIAEIWHLARQAVCVNHGCLPTRLIQSKAIRTMILRYTN